MKVIKTHSIKAYRETDPVYILYFGKYWIKLDEGVWRGDFDGEFFIIYQAISYNGGSRIFIKDFNNLPHNLKESKRNPRLMDVYIPASLIKIIDENN